MSPECDDDDCYHLTRTKKIHTKLNYHHYMTQVEKREWEWEWDRQFKQD